jgi:alanyl-tRNA synthetase
MGKPRTVAEIREAFLGFFEARGHQRMASDRLVPANDPTLLFTGAGMNQFKDEFLGRGRPLQRVTTSQKCLRVPDLENVGATPRHHTFFEMLGNFSFGDYFKKETIPWEWEFFTQTLGWDADRFVVTVFKDDEEAFQIWRDAVGLPAARIFRFGEDENFWPASAPSSGPNGPCGPCSEIYWDQTPGQPIPAAAGLQSLPSRFLEVGNCVFTQYDRRDGGELKPLPRKNIDVGLGLERIAAVAQNVPNNFGTDLFAPLLASIQEISGRSYGRDAADDVRMRRIADHARAVFFCIADGAAPGREGRGYVVRKILRRAVRDGLALGIQRPFMADLLPALQSSMAAAYPELTEQASTIQALCSAEEERFREVFSRGIARLESALDELKRQRGSTIFPGRVAFELHDTFGFPSDITEVVVREHGFSYDEGGFQAAMEEQRERARAGSDMSGEVFAESLAVKLRQAGIPATSFQGYETTQESARLLACVVGESLVGSVAAGTDCSLLLDRSPFYAEGGGQVGDSGSLEIGGVEVFTVRDTRQEEGYWLHVGRALAPLKVGQELRASVDGARRRATEAHHTATHLLHAALKEVLGAHVNQAGSKVAPESLRFDYTQPGAPSAEQLRRIEDLVNEQVLRAQPVGKRLCSLDAAKKEGVTALFGEKYGAEVRVVEVPGFSKELCGGTHVPNTGAIGAFRLLSDRALAAGVRRMEAVAGAVAIASFRADQERLNALEAELKAPADKLLERVQALKVQLKDARQKKAVAAPDAPALLLELAAAGPFAWKHLPDLDTEALRNLADGLRGKAAQEILLLTGGNAEAVPFMILCKACGPHKAGDLAKAFGRFVGGGGGGRPDYAQGQGTQGGELEKAVAAFQQQLGSPAGAP